MILYHGTPYAFDRFRPGSFMSKAIDVAIAFAWTKDCRSCSSAPSGSGPGRVVQCAVKPRSFVAFDRERLANLLIESGAMSDTPSARLRPWAHSWNGWEDIDAALLNEGVRRGVDLVTLTGVADSYYGGVGSKGYHYNEQREYTQYIIINPDVVRIVNECDIFDIIPAAA